ncbi:MAG TPA: hypothetical protein VJN63_09115 [Thermoplasmata archaeon]|nr:hypothetical protein [Thermoplasmata archaeon]
MALTVKIGDVYGLTYVASVATNWSATLKVRNRHGVVRKYTYRESAATSDRTAQSRTTERIAEDGEIVGFAAATGTVVAVKRGQFYMNVFVLGDSSSGDVEVNVAKGYVYAGKSLALGDSVEPGPGGGEGFLLTFTGANPAAGAYPSDAVPTNAKWRLRSYTIVLVTLATSASNRAFDLIANDGDTANRLAFHRNSNTQGASLTRTWMYQRGMDAQSVATITNSADGVTVLGSANLPPEGIILSEAAILKLVDDSGASVALQVDDNFAAPIIQVEEWLVL